MKFDDVKLEKMRLNMFVSVREYLAAHNQSEQQKNINDIDELNRIILSIEYNLYLQSYLETQQ